MEKTSTKGWEIFFSTYPTKEKKSEEKIIISDKHDFNEALKESIDKLNLKDLDETENIEEKHAFLDKVINLENNTTSSGVEASLAFQITKAFDKKEQSGKYYQLHHHDSIDRVFGTFKEKKESVIVLKGVDLNEHMKKLINKAKNDNLNSQDPHKNFKRFHGFVDLAALILLGVCLYYLNTKKEFSFFDNIKFILAYLFIFIGASIISLFIYSWFKTDVFDDVKEKLQPYIDKYFSFVNFITKILGKISPVVSTILVGILFLYLMYLSFIYLISLF